MSARETGPQFVVGDRFTEFLAHRGTVAASTLLMRLRAGGTAGPLRFGQGTTTAQRAELERLLGPDAGVPAAVDRAATHKRDDRNVLVSAPRPAGDGAWTADLVLDEGTETLADHITGQHVPAVTLVEAARQMWTAVTETFLLPPDGPRTRFVVLSTSARFLGYVFPLPAVVRLVLLDRVADGAGETFTCLVEVRHGERPGVELRGEYRVVPEAVAARQESLAARRALALAAGPPAAQRRPA
jgi:hypothetical protein